MIAERDLLKYSQTLEDIIFGKSQVALLLL